MKDFFMIFLKTIREKFGQHTIEYVVLLTLIMAGIIITGPYVIRSWNANLKGWEDSAIDSIQEEFIDIDPKPITECQSKNWVEDGCHLSRTNICTGVPLTCSELEMMSHLIFSPPGCQCRQTPVPEFLKCELHPCCCTKPVPTGRCGKDAGFMPGERPEPACNRQMEPRNPDGTCPDTMMEGYVECGDGLGPIHYGCMDEMPNGTDPTPGNHIYDACVFQCQPLPEPPDPSDPSAKLCTDDDKNLTANTQYSHVEHGGCTDPKKCEIECAECYHVVGAGMNTTCQKCEIGLDPGTCPAGTYDSSLCGVGQILTCCNC